MDRLSAYVRTLLQENQDLKVKISQQAGFAAENEALRAEVVHLSRELDLQRKGGVTKSDLETK